MDGTHANDSSFLCQTDSVRSSVNCLTSAEVLSLSLSVSASLILFLWLSLFSTTVSFVSLFLLSLLSFTLTLETFCHDRGCSTTLLTLPSIEPYLFLCLVSVGPAWWLLSCGYYILSPFLFTGVCFLCSVCIAFFFCPV